MEGPNEGQQQDDLLETVTPADRVDQIFSSWNPTMQNDEYGVDLMYPPEEDNYVALDEVLPAAASTSSYREGPRKRQRQTGAYGANNNNNGNSNASGRLGGGNNNAARARIPPISGKQVDEIADFLADLCRAHGLAGIKHIAVEAGLGKFTDDALNYKGLVKKEDFFQIQKFLQQDEQKDCIFSDLTLYTADDGDRGTLTLSFDNTSQQCVEARHSLRKSTLNLQTSFLPYDCRVTARLREPTELGPPPEEYRKQRKNKQWSFYKQRNIWKIDLIESQVFYTSPPSTKKNEVEEGEAPVPEGEQPKEEEEEEEVECNEEGLFPDKSNPKYYIRFTLMADVLESLVNSDRNNRLYIAAKFWQTIQYFAQKPAGRRRANYVNYTNNNNTNNNTMNNLTNDFSPPFGPNPTGNRSFGLLPSPYEDIDARPPSPPITLSPTYSRYPHTASSTQQQRQNSHRGHQQQQQQHQYRHSLSTHSSQQNGRTNSRSPYNNPSPSFHSNSNPIPFESRSPSPTPFMSPTTSYYPPRSTSPSPRIPASSQTPPSPAGVPLSPFPEIQLRQVDRQTNAQLQRLCIRLIKGTKESEENPQDFSRSFPGSMPISFGRRHWKTIQQAEYYVSEKTDGIRYMVLVKRSGVYLVDRSFDFFAVGGYDQLVKLYAMQGDTLLDGEMIRHVTTHRVTYLVFDALTINGSFCGNEDLSERLNRIRDLIVTPYRKAVDSKVIDRDDHPFIIIGKPFLDKKQTKKIFDHTRHEKRPDGEEVYYYHNDKRHHRTDGLIFTPDEPYVPYSCQRLFKWKYLEKNTMDFRITPARDSMSRMGGNNNRYLLTMRGNSMAGDDVEVDVAEFSPDEMKKLKDDLEKAGYTLESLRTVNIIAECAYDIKNGQWRYSNLRKEKRHPNFTRTVIGTLTAISENITKEEIVYRVTHTPKKDEWDKRQVLQQQQFKKWMMQQQQQQQQQRKPAPTSKKIEEPRGVKRPREEEPDNDLSNDSSLQDNKDLVARDPDEGEGEEEVGEKEEEGGRGEQMEVAEVEGGGVGVEVGARLAQLKGSLPRNKQVEDSDITITTTSSSSIGGAPLLIDEEGEEDEQIEGAGERAEEEGEEEGGNVIRGGGEGDPAFEAFMDLGASSDVLV